MQRTASPLLPSGDPQACRAVCTCGQRAARQQWQLCACGPRLAQLSTAKRMRADWRPCLPLPPFACLLLLVAAPVSRHSSNNAAFGEAAGSGAGHSTWDQLTQAISHGGNSLVEKIRRAASQPALGGGYQSAGFGDVADAVLRAPPRSPILKGSSGSSSRRDNDIGSIDLLARGTGLLPPKKDTKGD